MSILEDAAQAVFTLPVAAGVTFAAINIFKFVSSCAAPSFAKGGQAHAVAQQSCAFVKPALEVALGPLSSLKGSLEITVLVAMLITLVGASRLLARPAPKVAKKEKGEEKVAKHD